MDKMLLLLEKTTCHNHTFFTKYSPRLAALECRGPRAAKHTHTQYYVQARLMIAAFSQISDKVDLTIFESSQKKLRVQRLRLKRHDKSKGQILEMRNAIALQGRQTRQKKHLYLIGNCGFGIEMSHFFSFFQDIIAIIFTTPSHACDISNLVKIVTK